MPFPALFGISAAFGLTAWGALDAPPHLLHLYSPAHDRQRRAGALAALFLHDHAGALHQVSAGECGVASNRSMIYEESAADSGQSVN